MSDLIAAVRVRGPVDVPDKVESTMESLGIESRNSCVLVDAENEAVVGMLEKVSNYITYGPVSQEVLDLLEASKDVEASPGTVVGLHPPSGGFNYTRKHINSGGTLGNRESMDGLLSEML